MNIETGNQEFAAKIAAITCHQCGTNFTIDTIIASVSWQGNYYCQECGKAIIEEWKKKYLSQN